MAAKSTMLEKDLSCPVCYEIFNDPVVLGCSHSFCRACLYQCRGEGSSLECPLCRSKAQSGSLLPNLALRNTVETYLRQKSEDEVVEKVKGDHRCGLHGEKLLLFCSDDKETLCLVCQTSKKHKNHQVCPVEEAALELKGELKTALNPIKEKLDRFAQVKEECERTAEHIRNQAQLTETQVKAEFEKLHQFLRNEEKARLAALREEEEKKTQIMREKIENTARNISTLSDKITAIEKALETDDIPLLQEYQVTKHRAQCKLQDPVLLSGALINVAKHLGNLKFRVWEKMLEMVQYTPVTLDPNTTVPWLSLSDDLTSVRYTGVKQQLPNNPERFDSCVSVFGSEGFTSGKHSWEVEVGTKTTWTMGVVKESITRKGQLKSDTGSGFWVLTLRNGDQYKAAGVTKPLRLRKKPVKIKVQLEYDRGVVSFYDPSDMSHIHTFKHTFTERIFPYFSPAVNSDGKNRGHLLVLPMQLSITMT